MDISDHDKDLTGVRFKELLGSTSKEVYSTENGNHENCEDIAGEQDCAADVVEVADDNACYTDEADDSGNVINTGDNDDGNANNAGGIDSCNVSDAGDIYASNSGDVDAGIDHHSSDVGDGDANDKTDVDAGNAVLVRKTDAGNSDNGNACGASPGHAGDVDAGDVADSEYADDENAVNAVCDDDFGYSPFPEPDAKVLSEKQEVFPAPHINQCPRKLHFDKTITISGEYGSCWRSIDDCKIFLGGKNKVTTLRTDGQQTVFWLRSEDMSVMSGLAVTSEKQLIYVRHWRDKYSNIFSVYTVNINEDHGGYTPVDPINKPEMRAPPLHPVDMLGLNDRLLLPVNMLKIKERPLHPINSRDVKGRPLYPINKLEVRGTPVCLFNIDKFRYGILCEDGIIEFFTLKSILLDCNPESSDVVKLKIKTCSKDTACATANGNICVASPGKNTIHIYTTDGELLHEYRALEKIRSVGDAWFSLFSCGNRILLQCCEDGIVMANDKGCICTLKEGVLSKIIMHNSDDRERLRQVNDCVTSEGRTWYLQRDTQSKVHVYNTSSEADDNSEHQYHDGEVFLKPLTDSCLKELQYDKTITTQYKHTCCWRSDVDDKIFLGGKNKISILREDGRQQTYNISGDKTSARSTRTVISGLAVTPNKHLICVEHPASRNAMKHCFYRIDIPDELLDGSHLQPEEISEVNNPICVFMTNSLQYGVLCETKPFPEILLLSWKQVLDYEPFNIEHSLTLYDKYSINDTACSTPAGDICVSSFERKTIYVYNTEGKEIYQYSRESEMRALGDAWYCLFSGGGRLYLHCHQDGLVVLNTIGHVYTLQGGCLSRVNIHNTDDRQRQKSICACVSTGSKLWFVDTNTQLVHVCNTSAPTQTQTPPLAGANSTIEHQHDKEVLFRPPTYPCPDKLVYDKTITTQNKHICCWRSDEDDKIFLGGKNIITILRDDGSEQTYNIRGDKMFSRFNRAVISGVAVTSNKHLICVEASHPGAGYNIQRCLYRVDIPYILPGGSRLETILLVSADNPIRVFMANSLQYGVLCLTKSYANIQLLTWEQVLGYDLLVNLKYTALKYPCSITDTACITPDGDICVSSGKDGDIYRYNIKGDVLDVYGSISRGDDPNHKTLVASPKNPGLFLQGCKNGIIVVNADGVVLTKLKDDGWQFSNYVETARLGKIRHCVYSGNRMWVIDGNHTQMVLIYTTLGSTTTLEKHK